MNTFNFFTNGITHKICQRTLDRVDGRGVLYVFKIIML